VIETLPLAAADLEWTLAGILLGVSVLLVLAYVTAVPYPIWLTVGGALLAFAPGVPDVRLEPDLVLIIALPPLLYAAALFSDLRELRRNARPIGLLAVGLVLATTFAVAAVAHEVIDGLSWEAAIVLGAVLGPTDPVAATSIAGRVGAPRRIVTKLEGESLVNDATALTAFKFAVAAATAGTFSLSEAAGEFVLSLAGGVAIGAVVSYVVILVRRRIIDGPMQAFFSIVTPYFAYLPADAIGASGVLAAVTTGIAVGWQAPRLVNAEVRLQLYAMWEVLVFLLNSMLFILVGLQLPSVIDALNERDPETLAWYALAIALTVMAIRLVWVMPFMYLLFRGGEEVRRSWRGAFVVGFTGMRGAVSLAAALAIPESVPARDLIVFLCYTTILWTVCVEGLSLPWLLRMLGVHEGDLPQHEEDEARLLVADAALRRVDELLVEDWVGEETAERVRGVYTFRRNRFAQRLGKEVDGADEDIDGRSQHYQRLTREILAAERAALLDLRRAGRIGDETLRRVQRDLDLEETRLQ
jgi:CPA1 family monovalent cation:H+ antiporter